MMMPMLSMCLKFIKHEKKYSMTNFYEKHYFNMSASLNFDIHLHPEKYNLTHSFCVPMIQRENGRHLIWSLPVFMLVWQSLEFHPHVLKYLGELRPKEMGHQDSVVNGRGWIRTLVSV